MCEQGVVLTKGVLTHDRRRSETIFCVHAGDSKAKHA